MRHVHENLFRGPRPESLSWLQRRNIKTVICLQSGIKNVIAHDKYRDIHWPDSGIKYYMLEQNDFTPPTFEDVQDFLRIVKMNAPQGRIYVHCMAGVDRTGFMCAAYRMKVQGWEFGRAWDEMKELGSHWWYRWWGFALRKIGRAL